jgi:formylglycine-generating enzyme required for sulfatase activity
VFIDCDSCPEMVVIPEGIFQPRRPAAKGSPGSDKGSRRTTVIRQFALGKTEVTQRQWKAVMGRNPSKFSQCGEDCPVERVSWKDVQEFIRRLNQKTGRIYRLPGDAEWEYACLAGSPDPYCGGDKLDSVAWYESNSERTTHPVAGKLPNAWGLYDMTGNVWEWTQACADDKATTTAAGDCKRPNLRGGSWGSMQRLGTSSYRNRYPAKSRAYDIVSRRSDFGFRLAATLP